MTAATLTAIIMASVMVLGMLGSLVALVFKLGTMNGRLASFMEVSQRDRNDIVNAVKDIETQLDKHIEWHQGGYKP